MVRIVDWAAAHARMVLAVMLLSIGVGMAAYIGLPKEGSPDIEFPGYYVSTVFGGISAEDSEDLLIKPLEEKLDGIDGLDYMQSTASEGYGGIFLQFEFGLDADATLAEIRERVSQAAAEFPAMAEDPVVSEISLADFPIIIAVLSGDLPERTMQSVAETLQDEIESLAPILEVGITGKRTEMVEVIVEPLRLEAYDVTAADLITAVNSNNQLIAAGEVESASGSFAVKVPASFENPEEVRNIPIITHGERVVTLGDIAEIYPTFEDRTGIARHNGETTIALPVVKRKGFNIIETSQLVRDRVNAIQSGWPDDLNSALKIDFVHDQSVTVEAMVSQLQGAVLTAVLIVMIVVLATLGIRSSLLVGFAIPISFLLCFTFLALLNIPISTMVMFGLILSVGMLVDSAIVVVELADRRMAEGSRPMTAYVEAAKRMFWPIISSTATTLCAFLPMLFWPGMPGQFMGTLPITLIFVLSASLCVALVYLPVVGGIAARMGIRMSALGLTLTHLHWSMRTGLVVLFLLGTFGAALITLNPALVFGSMPLGPINSSLPGVVLFVILATGLAISINSLRPGLYGDKLEKRRRRTLFGWFISLIVGNPVMPFVVLAMTAILTIAVFRIYGADNHGVEFFVDTEPE
ncbi:MAG: efflux RND transporter permease subunit, partial [Rhodobacteraceae bacterium]|nr:efflux RND transporter permease subunit [Paracoccaceae bacterium]